MVTTSAFFSYYGIQVVAYGLFFLVWSQVWEHGEVCLNELDLRSTSDKAAPPDGDLYDSTMRIKTYIVRNGIGLGARAHNWPRSECGSSFP